MIRANAIDQQDFAFGIIGPQCQNGLIFRGLIPGTGLLKVRKFNYDQVARPVTLLNQRSVSVDDEAGSIVASIP